jgi:hypothetical protein
MAYARRVLDQRKRKYQRVGITEELCLATNINRTRSVTVETSIANDYCVFRRSAPDITYVATTETCHICQSI